MWKSWNLCALLAGMQNAATMGNSIAVPQKIKNRITIWSSNPNDIHPKEQKAEPPREIRTPLFIAA